jgi:hypothetical protein
MKTKFSLSLLALVTLLFLPLAPVDAGGARYISYWKCSDGNTYGMSADGNKRWLYLPSDAQLFFSGIKNGQTYEGTIYWAGQQILVSGPVSHNDTRVALYSSDGRTWVLNFSHK